MKSKKIKVKKSHKITIFFIVITSVFIFVAVTLLLANRIVPNQIVQGVHATCSSINEDSLGDSLGTTTHGWPMKSYIIDDEECGPRTFKVYPLGLLVDAIPGIMLSTFVIALATRHFRKKYAIIASR